MRKTRIIKLDEGGVRHIRFLADRVEARQLAEGKKTIVCTVTRTGDFFDPRYGNFSITREMLLSMVRNFEAGVYGQQIMLDVSHKPQDGSAGVFKRLFLDGSKLRAEIELTEFGLEAVQKRGMIYLSAEFDENYTTNEEPRKACGPTLLGAALTPRPVIKRLDPIQLSEGALDGAPRTLVSERITRILNEEKIVMKEFLKKLREALQAKKLAEAMITQLCETFEKAAEPLATDDLRRALMENFIVTGENLAKQLAELPAGSAAPVIQLSVAGPTGMDQAAVLKLLSDQQAEQTRKLAETQQKRETLVAIFTKALADAKLEGLTDDERKELSAAADLITAEMTEEQVRKLAETQIAIGNRMGANKKLASMGYQGPAGHMHISVDDSNGIRSLQEQILIGLRGTSHHGAGRVAALADDKLHPFAARVLAEFDRLNAHRLHAEHKALSGGTTGMGDTSLPAGFQRTVIREALSDLRVLELIQTLTDPAATVTTGIPYEQRDMSAVYNDGVVFEGQGIHRASISQAMDYAYIMPMKLAFLISNEVIHFSRASQINWDAYARNVESNARVMRELIVRRISNELQRAADAYLAAAITGEDIASQLDGSTKHTIKTAQFPIVRPHQQKDLQGNNVGNAENAIAISINGAAITAWDGTGTQTAGTYYRVTSYNMGYIQFVDEAGAPATPAAGTGATTGYSYATNVAKFDLDNGSTALEVHLNGLLRSIGARKAMMKDDRYVTPDFLLMSNTLNDTITNAEQFTAQAKRDGTNTGAQGDLEVVKGVPAWATNAPGVDLGDERILMGVRGTLTYTVAKPFMTGEPFEAVNSTGKPTGQKQAYGEEYSAIKVPTPIRNRLTSVLAYSATGR